MTTITARHPNSASNRWMAVVDGFQLDGTYARRADALRAGRKMSAKWEQSRRDREEQRDRRADAPLIRGDGPPVALDDLGGGEGLAVGIAPLAIGGIGQAHQGGQAEQREVVGRDGRGQAAGQVDEQAAFSRRGGR